MAKTTFAVSRSRAINRRALLALGVALLALIPYVNGLRNGFTFDDVALVAENPRIRSIAGMSACFTTDWWNGARPQSLLYRPLTMATFAIDYAAARQGDPDAAPARLDPSAAFPFHVQNVLWHVAASVACLFLVLELFASPGLALATAALFAVHPVHTEAVDGIVGRAELMAACFSFLALIAAFKVMKDDPPGGSVPAGAGVLLLLALLSKEQAIVIPAVPLLWIALRPPDERKALIRRRSFRRLLIALVVATLAYLAARTLVLGTPVGGAARVPGGLFVDNPIAGATGVARVLTPVRVFGEVVRLLVFPKTLSADYSYDQIPLVSGSDAATLLALLALCALPVAAFSLRRRMPAVSFGILFFFLAFALTSNLFIVIGTILGERLLYLPSAGACLAIAGLCVAAGKRPGRPWVAVALTTVLVALGAGRTIARNRDWKDNLTVFGRAAADSPRSCKAHNAYASELLASGRLDDARAVALRSLAIAPRYPDVHRTLSKTLRALANAENDPARRDALRHEAIEHARTAIELLSSDAGGGEASADAWSVLGGLALDAKDPGEALADFAKSLEHAPAFVPAVIGTGVALSMQGDPKAALLRFEQARTLDPGNTEAKENAELTRRQLEGDPDALANLHGVNGGRLLEERRYADALAEFREAARLQPRAARSYLGIGSALAAEAQAATDAGQKRRLRDDAIAAFEQALQLEPNDPTAQMNLGIVYLGDPREPAKVIEHFSAYLRLVPNAPQRAQMEGTIRQMEAILARERK